MGLGLAPVDDGDQVVDKLIFQPELVIQGIQTEATTSNLRKRFFRAGGSWPGNDTVWRMIYDLNKIILYAPKEGGGLAEAQVLAMMAERVAVMRRGVATGLRGTEYADRILGPQAGRFAAMDQAGRLLDGGVLNRMIAYVTALMEAKSAMEVIVAAPTAGSCGGLPGACLGAADAMGLADADVASGSGGTHHRSQRAVVASAELRA